MTINYNRGKGQYKNWLVVEDEFNSNYLAKYETIFTLGNGYMGLRAATEEKYLGEMRGFYVAGLFDKFADEVTELPNLPDWLGMEIKLGGERFNLTQGKIISYKRTLNLKDGLLTRQVEWESPRGNKSKLSFSRFVSLDRYHLAGMKVNIKPINYSGEIEIITGFDGQVTNSGTQHFIEGDKRVLDDGCYYITSITQESRVPLVTAARNLYLLDKQEIDLQERIITGRRQLFVSARNQVSEGQEFTVEKLVTIYSGIDKEFENRDINNDGFLEEIISKSLADLREGFSLGYKQLELIHKNKWHQLWNDMDISIEGPGFDQLAIRFAQFHLIQMTPAHDDRISVAAKGLSGEGYKGHVFWDTEIFILPFFIYTYPEIARKLLIYRYHTLEGARKKARENGYRGAMYSWESARTGEETTPEFGSVDIKTGQPIRIWCGEIEQHITADVAYAVWHYFEATRDYDFMYDYGAEILLDTARFWSSRVEYNERMDIYEIKNVIGPDEYSEHVNNNAYTNYMVKWHIDKATEIAEHLKANKPLIWEKLSTKLKLSVKDLSDWKEISKKIYTPLDEESGLIEQFEGFMNQKEIDLTPYQGKVGSIFQDLSWEEITSSQVIKQADVIILLFLLGDKFSREIKEANWDFYEPRTLHDSSLSPSIHSILAVDIDKMETAYKYFIRASKIDLGKDMKSCDAGLHAASLGGLWQIIAMGFAGMRIINNNLVIDPKLPREWSGLKINFYWRGEKYLLVIDKDNLKLKPLSCSKVPNSIELKEVSD